RQTGEIIKVQEVMVTAQDLKDLLSMNCSEHELNKFDKTHELDTSVTLSGLRFRANFYKTIKGPACVCRRVESKIPEMDQFNLPQSLYDIVDFHKGLVLVTGPTGSGKSTTLAAIVNEINKTRTANIITVEDPVEFIHQDNKSIISHREVGKQTETFAAALKAALREDPDVILVGEMRDLETISLALTAAETGHLVFGTLHTSGAPSTINRIIDVFPPEQQEQIRAQISTSLKMVVTQRLLKTRDGAGRVGAFEIMKCTAPIQNLIREAKIHQIPSIMQTAVRDGMITMEKSLEELAKAGKIDPGAARSEH
ncbi:PilT/PilU family type 4a pilus ATPase, partial [bacterium]|nr:PilT/PilU family type 4a pilus ATPase [bacterium]